VKMSPHRYRNCDSMNCVHRPVARETGTMYRIQVTECPDVLSTPGPDSDPAVVPQYEETRMDKWKIIKDSKLTQISVSAGTIVAVATLAGAGLKWA